MISRRIRVALLCSVPLALLWQVLKFIQHASINSIKKSIRNLIELFGIVRGINAGSNKRALVCYTISPFLYEQISHTNYRESIAVVNQLALRGYVVDVVHFTHIGTINYSRYDLILGFGEPFENSFLEEKSITRIHYLTGAYSQFQNRSEIERVIEANKKYGGSLRPRRLVKWTWSQSLMMSDAVVVVGNEWTLSTYVPHTTAPLFAINVTALEGSGANLRPKRFGKPGKFIWFGSAGLVHKGLDLCLEFFRANPSYELHICGPREHDFMTLFQAELSLPNIHYHGFITVGSPQYNSIVGECLFALLPTCSEGQATALLTVMADGLIPIATRNSGVDVSELGIPIDGLTSALVAEAISRALALSSGELQSMSDRVRSYVRDQHCIDSFEARLSRIFEDIGLRA